MARFHAVHRTMLLAIDGKWCSDLESITNMATFLHNCSISDLPDSMQIEDQKGYAQAYVACVAAKNTMEASSCSILTKSMIIRDVNADRSVTKTGIKGSLANRMVFNIIEYKDLQLESRLEAWPWNVLIVA